MKREKINGLTINRFEKKDLTEKILMPEENAKLVMKYQKTFPELLAVENKDNKFIINAETLWNELSKPQKHFVDWMKRKILPFFTENIDYITYSQVCEIGNGAIRNVTRYMFTIDIAKEVAMFTGTDMRSSEEVRAKGKLVRNYFIKVEKALKDIIEWDRVREPEKGGWNKLTDTLQKHYIDTHDGKKPEAHTYIKEANMLNENLLGKKAEDIRKELGVSDKQTREHLCTEVNQALADLQMIDESLIIGNIAFDTRKNIIDNTCKCKYAKLKKAVYNELHIVA